MYPHPRHPWLLLGAQPRDSHVESCFLHQQPRSSPQGGCWWGCVVTVVPACLIPCVLAACHPLVGMGYPTSALCLAPGSGGCLLEARSPRRTSGGQQGSPSTAAPFPPLPAAGRRWEVQQIPCCPGWQLSLFRRGSGQVLSPSWACLCHPLTHTAWGGGGGGPRGPATFGEGWVAAVMPTGQRTLHHRGDVLETLVLLNPSDKSLCDEVSGEGGGVGC